MHFYMCNSGVFVSSETKLSSPEISRVSNPNLSFCSDISDSTGEGNWDSSFNVNNLGFANNESLQSNVPSPLNISTPDSSLLSSSTSFNDNTDEVLDPDRILKSIRLSIINRLVIGQLNINSLRNKFESL